MTTTEVTDYLQQVHEKINKSKDVESENEKSDGAESVDEIDEEATILSGCESEKVTLSSSSSVVSHDRRRSSFASTTISSIDARINAKVRGFPRASKPGAVTYVGFSSLESLERKTLEKVTLATKAQLPQQASTSVTPGAVSAQGAALTQKRLGRTASESASVAAARMAEAKSVCESAPASRRVLKTKASRNSDDNSSTSHYRRESRAERDSDSEMSISDHTRSTTRSVVGRRVSFASSAGSLAMIDHLRASAERSAGRVRGRSSSFVSTGTLSDHTTPSSIQSRGESPLGDRNIVLARAPSVFFNAESANIYGEPVNRRSSQELPVEFLDDVESSLPAENPNSQHGSYRSLSSNNSSHVLSEDWESHVNLGSVGRFQVFKAAAVLNAVGVSIVPSPKEESMRERRKNMSRGVICAIVLIAVVVSVSVPLSLKIFQKKPIEIEVINNITAAPSSSSPTPVPSSAPTSEFFAQVQAKVEIISDSVRLRTRGTAENNALHWFFYDDEAGSAGGRSVDHPLFLQRYILAMFYFSTNGGSGWLDCGRSDDYCAIGSRISWLSKNDECDWGGIFCVGSKVYKLEFGTYTGNNLIGTLPRELGELSTLEHLVIQSNYLTGTIPESFSQLTLLRSFIVSNNSLSDPFPESILENMSSLEHLYLEQNHFGGTIPSLITTLTTLLYLRLFENDFSGPIPTEIGALTNLGWLELNNLKLSGTLPSEIGLLTKLMDLKIQENRLFGTLPAETGNLLGLKLLNIANNTFSGTLAPSIALIGGNNSMVKSFYFDGNNFTGPIPSEIGTIVGLEKLSFTNNTFTGSIPSEICNVSGITVDVDCSAVECVCCSPACF